MYRRIARQVTDPDDVDDLVQEVFITAYTRLDQVRDHSKFPGWLRSVADNAVRMWRRHKYAQLQMAVMFKAGHPGSEIIDEMADLRIVLRQALGRLPEAHRQVIVHHYLNGYSYQATATLLGIKVDTVRSRLQKARLKLRQEVGEMSDTRMKKQSIPLNRTDLTIIRWARDIVSEDPERAGLGCLYLDPKGRIVATDGHRLLVWSCDPLKQLTSPVLLDTWYNIDFPDVDRAQLLVDTQGAIFKIKHREDLLCAYLDSEYPDYPRVIPESWSINAEIITSDLLGLISLMPDHLEPKHPIDPDESWEYNPVVEIRISIPEQTLSLLTTRDMGYTHNQEYKTEIPPYDPVGDWSFSASIPVKIKTGSDDERFRIWVDYNYLKTCIQVLNDIDSQTITARFNTSLTAMVFDSADVGQCRLLQMPLRMHGTGTDARQAG